MPSFISIAALSPALALFLAGCASHTSPPAVSACPQPGAATSWAAAYCMYELETDDLEAVIASSCFARAVKHVEEANDECEERVHWKTRICERSVSRLQSHASVPACVSDVRFLPKGIEGGF